MCDPPRATLDQLVGVISQRQELVRAYLKDTSEELSNSKLLKRFGRRLNDLRLELKAVDFSDDKHRLEAQRSERLEPPEGVVGRGSREAVELRKRYRKEKSEGGLLSELVAKRRRLVILGDPGSGKTEFLKSQAASTARTWLERLEQGKARVDDIELPIFLPLKLLSTSLENLKFPNSSVRPDSKVLRQRCLDSWSEKLVSFLDDYGLTRTSAGISHREFFSAWLIYGLRVTLTLNPRLLDWMWDRLIAGAASIYLDGWDEISDGLILRADEYRNIIADKLEEFVKGTGCRIIVSSRVVGYNQSLFSNEGKDELDSQPGRSALRIESFHRDEIVDFVRTWFKDDWSIGKKMLTELDDNEAVIGLAANPLMATLLCQSFSPGGGRVLGFPFRRIDVYKRILEGFLGEWALARDGTQQVLLDRSRRIRIADKLDLLVHVARQYYRAPESVLTTSALKKHLENYLSSKDGIRFRLRERAHQKLSILSDEELCIALADLLGDELIDTDGVLVEVQEDVYDFLHLTFFEYLAAQSIEGADLYGVAGKRNFEGWWEVGLMAGELHAQKSEDEAWEFINALCPEPYSKKSNSPCYKYQLAWLAGQVLLDNEVPLGNIEDDRRCVLEMMRSWLTGIVTEAKLPVRARARAGVVLGYLGDTRRGVGNDQNGIPEMNWIPIKSGKFIMGGSREWGAGRKFSCNAIKEDFRISAYPVTNQQYESFLDAPDGYRTKKWWEGLSWQPKESDHPDIYGDGFETPNHPRVGVNWFQAVAFCRWLTGKLRDSKKLSKYEEVTLPSDCQWERAARGKDGAIYPWGDDGLDSSLLCNCYYSGIKSTSAVGIFPVNQAISSLYDAAGNVHEWTMTKWKGSRKNYSPDNAPEGTEARLLLGGAWDDNHWDGTLRCSERVIGEPHGRSDHIGFRVVVVSLRRTARLLIKDWGSRLRSRFPNR